MESKARFCAGVVGIIGAITSAPALAEDSFQVGLAASINSSFYRGAGNESYVFPLVVAEYKRFYLQGIQGGYRFYEDEAGQSLSLEIRRTFDGYRAADSQALAGTADRGAAWEAGLAYTASVAGGQIKAKLLRDISNRHQGLSARFEYERPFWTGDSHIVSWYVGSEYWSRKKTDYYFGVSPGETTPTRSAYTAGNSHGVHLGANAVKRLDERITLIASAEYLVASAAIGDSPLTARRDQWSAYAGIFYRF